MMCVQSPEACEREGFERDIDVRASYENFKIHLHERLRGSSKQLEARESPSLTALCKFDHPGAVINIRARAQSNTHEHTHTCMNKFTNTHAHTHVQTHAHTHTHTCTHVRAHTHTLHTHTHTRTHL